MSRTRHINQPRQRLSFKKKNNQWRRDNVDYGDTYSFYNSVEVRNSLQNKIINLQLYNGIVNVEDMMKVVNPNSIDASFIPENIVHNPIIVPKIDLLVGEEINRPFDYNFIVTDSNSITRKMEDRKQVYIDNIVKFLQENYSDEELQVKMQELDKHMRYTWKDMREKMANQISKYYYQKQNFKDQFSKGFKDALIFGEEMYLIDIVHDEPRLTVLNPLKVRNVLSGASDKIEDSSMIVIEDYKSPNQLIDEYADELKAADIDRLLNYESRGESDNYTDDQNNHVVLFDKLGFGTFDSAGVTELNGHLFGSNYSDEFGNIRELRVRWKSLRKALKVKYYDDYGETQYRFESEEYIVDEDLGEEATVFYISEGWEGILLGKDIYIKMRPLPVQYSSVNNPHKNHLGVIGQVYNTNQGKAVSLVDRAKNYQYLYDAVWDRTIKAIAANYGKILEVDLAKIPDGWEIEKWMHFAVVNKMAFVDSFKEGNKGQSTGKLAGTMNTVGGRTLDMETGNYIQQHIQLLEFIKMELSEVIGITKQREGQVQNRETVGGVERSVSQSSHITEYWFNTHENLKLRVMEAFLETAKYVLSKQGNRQVQYVLDDNTIEVLNLTDSGFSEGDYGVIVTDTNKYKQLEDLIKQNAQAFLQNGGGFKALLDIAFSNSLMDMRRKIEQSEDDMHARQQEQSQMQQQVAQQQMEQQAALEQAKLEADRYKVDADNETKRYIAELNANLNAEEPVSIVDDGIINPLEDAKLKLDYEKVKNDYLIRMKDLDDKMKMHKDDVVLQKEANQISKMQKKQQSSSK